MCPLERAGQQGLYDAGIKVERSLFGQNFTLLWWRGWAAHVCGVVSVRSVCLVPRLLLCFVQNQNTCKWKFPDVPTYVILTGTGGSSFQGPVNRTSRWLCMLPLRWNKDRPNITNMFVLVIPVTSKWKICLEDTVCCWVVISEQPKEYFVQLEIRRSISCNELAII